MKKTTDLIYSLRKDYQSRSLDEQTARPDPFEQFEQWMSEAIAAEVEEPNAMVVSTVSETGKPSSRIVLLRGFDRRGFVFYTNYDSKKATEIGSNPNASLLFFWPALERQIRVDGVVSKTSRAESEAYFATRPRESQIGAWASAQSRALESRRELEEKIDAIEKRFAGQSIECPDFWGGFRLEPEAFEFWQGRRSRLHDRLSYTKTGHVWKIGRLSP